MRERTLRSLGGDSLEVSVIGLGCLALDNRPGARERAPHTFRAALDAGITLFDTADSYGDAELGGAAAGTNEALVGELVRRFGVGGAVTVATKVGHVRTPDGGWDVDGSPGHIARAIDASLTRLGVDSVDLYQHHRPDPAVPFEESLGALAEVHRQGKARFVGVSNVDVDQIRTACAVLGPAFATVQNEFSPTAAAGVAEIDLCRELGVTYLAYSPLGGIGPAGALGTRVPAFAEVAWILGVSAQQVALAWMQQRHAAVLPIPGASRAASVSDSAAAADLVLPEAALALLP